MMNKICDSQEPFIKISHIGKGAFFLSHKNQSYWKGCTFFKFNFCFYLIKISHIRMLNTYNLEICHPRNVQTSLIQWFKSRKIKIYTDFNGQQTMCRPANI